VIIKHGYCLKCGRDIARGKSAGHLYNHVKLAFEDGSTMSVALCNECKIEKSEYPEVMALFNEYMKMNEKSWRRDDRILDHELSRENLGAIVFNAQGGRCLGCHEKIKGPYVLLNGGAILHENCNLPGVEDPLLMRQRREKADVLVKT